MRLLFLGDSITQGQGASCEDKKYVNLVGKKVNCEVVNYGVCGTRIGRQTRINGAVEYNYDFRLRAQIMLLEADKVFVFGGTNDYQRGALILGDPVEKKVGTFCGEICLLIEDLIEKYGKEKLCFLLPTPRFDEEGVCCKGENGDELGATLEEYVNALRSVIQSYKIDIIDLYKDSFPKPLSKTGDEYTVDGLHPNDKGHALIADKIVKYMKDK